MLVNCVIEICLCYSKSMSVLFLIQNLILSSRKKINDIYVVIIEKIDSSNFKCLKVANEDPWLWHRRFCHFNMDLLKEISKKNLLEGCQKSYLKRIKSVMLVNLKNKSKFLLNPKNMFLPQNFWNFYILIYLVLHKLLV